MYEFVIIVILLGIVMPMVMNFAWDNISKPKDAVLSALGIILTLSLIFWVVDASVKIKHYEKSKCYVVESNDT